MLILNSFSSIDSGIIIGLKTFTKQHSIFSLFHLKTNEEKSILTKL